MIPRMIPTAYFCGIFPTKNFTEAMAGYSRLVGVLQANAFRTINKWKHVPRRVLTMDSKSLNPH